MALFLFGTKDGKVHSKNIMYTINNQLFTDVGAIIVIVIVTYKTYTTGKEENR